MSTRWIFSMAMMGCAVGGSGVSATETRDVGAFSSVHSAAGLDVFVTLGDTPSVVVTCDDNLVPRIRTRVRGDELTIDIDGPRSVNPSVGCRTDVVTPTLRELTSSGSGSTRAEGPWAELERVLASGSGAVHVDGDLPALTHVDATGSGEVQVHDIDTTSLSVLLSGSGSIHLDGRAEQVVVALTGSGTIDGRDFTVDHADVTLSGSGTIVLTVTEETHAHLTGSGDLELFGGSTVISESTGSGRVIVR